MTLGHIFFCKWGEARLTDFSQPYQLTGRFHRAMAAPAADGAVPKDVMAYLAASNVSVYDHLSQVLAKVAVTSPKDAAANFDKISRGVLEDTFVWPVEAQPIKEDMTAQTASRDLFKVALPDPDVETAIVGPGAAKAADTYVPDIMAEAEMLQWSGASLGEVEMCKIMLAVRKLAGEHPELKSVRFFGKFLGTGSDYLVCEGELTDLDEAAPKDLPPNHPGRRNIEKVEHHNMLKYYVCSYPGAPWLALPNLRFDQLQAVGSVRKLLTGNPAAPIRSFPPFPGETEASYLRAKIAYIGMHTCMSPAGYFKELPADPDAQPARLRPSIAASGDWAAPEDPAALLAMGAWTMHYPGVPQPDAFPDDFGPDEEGNWPAVPPRPPVLVTVAKNRLLSRPPVPTLSDSLCRFLSQTGRPPRRRVSRGAGPAGGSGAVHSAAKRGGACALVGAAVRGAVQEVRAGGAALAGLPRGCGGRAPEGVLLLLPRLGEPRGRAGVHAADGAGACHAARVRGRRVQGAHPGHGGEGRGGQRCEHDPAGGASAVPGGGVEVLQRRADGPARQDGARVEGAQGEGGGGAPRCRGRCQGGGRSRGGGGR